MKGTKAIFLSASVPRQGRAGSETFDPFLIKEAVTALIEVILGRYLLVWGGQPAITPIVAASSEGYDVSFSGVATLYQSAYFREEYPSDNRKFENFVETGEIRGDKAASLALMRKQMLTSHEFYAGVFIGGMEGVVEEYEMFKKLHPLAIRLPVPSPGGTSRNLFELEKNLPTQLMDAVDFPFWFQQVLSVDLSTPRSRSLKSS